MDVPTLRTFLSPILNVASVWNTGETGDINYSGFFESQRSLIVSNLTADLQILKQMTYQCATAPPLAYFT